jgi:hypothetical protein
MKVRLKRLIDEERLAYVEENRAFNAASEAATGGQPQPDLASPEGLQEARDRLTRSLAQPGAVGGRAPGQGRQPTGPGENHCPSAGRDPSRLPGHPRRRLLPWLGG